MINENNYKTSSFDVIIIGGGMVGLSLANQLIERGITSKIAIIDKEERLGRHTSGRNSGVLHAGIYYKPKTLKARVCVNGAKRLRQWIRERDLSINECGKVIVPTKEKLDRQLEILKERGEENGATVQLMSESELKAIAPEVRSASGRGLWSPNTAVVKPLEVIKCLQKELRSKGVQFILNSSTWKNDAQRSEISLDSDKKFSYGHLFNCAGLHADHIAHKFGVGLKYSIMPFKGLYWKINSGSRIKPRVNIYPVPDLSVPFLGVHFTPSADEEPVVSIGPTATPAWGRENYVGVKGIEPAMAIKNLGVLAKQYILNKGNFRRYVHEQAFLAVPPLLIKAAQELIPSIELSDIELSNKVAIRSQLFNHETQRLEDDFQCLPGPNSTHILNAISPAFTASFELADLILEKSKIVNKLQ